MSDQQKVTEMLRRFDPARGLQVRAVDARALMVDAPGHQRRASRLVLVAAAVLVLLVGGGAVVALRAIHAPTGATPEGAVVDDMALDFWPVVRPMAFEQGDPPAAPKAAAYESQHGKYTHIGVVSWNQVFDDAPGGNSQIIVPQERDIWFDEQGAGRIVTRQLPAVFPNEASRQYWKNRKQPTGEPGPHTDDLGAGMVGSTKPLPTVDHLFERGPGEACWAIRDLFSVHVVPLDLRARLLDRLAHTEGVEWVGRTVDRAGRAGVGARVRNGDMTEVLVFDPTTGVLLAWDEIDQHNAVQGATLFLKTERTDRLPA
ncbi:hypothetical protein [Dactylosporangium sp. NPDC049140]|uniref:hypothetical protein n=1 Tax=Dactylosporangium sp. NPDC049140 TaxID=3155647 RepID=UPI0033FD5C3C